VAPNKGRGEPRLSISVAHPVLCFKANIFYSRTSATSLAILNHIVAREWDLIRYRKLNVEWWFTSWGEQGSLQITVWPAYEPLFRSCVILPARSDIDRVRSKMVDCPLENLPDEIRKWIVEEYEGSIDDGIVATAPSSAWKHLGKIISANKNMGVTRLQERPVAPFGT